MYRLSPSEAVSQKEHMIGKEINLVLMNSTVFLGKLLALDPTIFTCANMRGKKFSFPFSEVKEIIYDQHSSY